MASSISRQSTSYNSPSDVRKRRGCFGSGDSLPKNPGNSWFPFPGASARVATHRDLFDSVGASEVCPRLDAKRVYHHKIFPSCLIF